MKAEILQKAQSVVALLKSKNLKIATAESCTGGLVSAYITAVPGASQVLELGVCSYSNNIKNRILNVDRQTLDTSGAVCGETAMQMAHNVRKLSQADIGVSVTGVAGPTEQDGHPVGVVFVGISVRDILTFRRLDIPPQSRDFVREQSVSLLFDMITEYIN